MPPWRRRTTRDVLAAGDAERERIAQDLHDGVQQRLTALGMGLSVAAERFGERDTEAGAVLQGFGEDVERVIDELRDLAHGIYPALLTSFGLAAALDSAGVRSGRPVTVQTSGVRRCRPEVEIAVYFACLAALDNAARHAGPVPISVDLSDTRGALDFTVCDSGAGFDPAKTRLGAGIANMRERIAAVGGTLAVDSAPGTRNAGAWQRAGPRLEITAARRAGRSDRRAASARAARSSQSVALLLRRNSNSDVRSDPPRPLGSPTGPTFWFDGSSRWQHLLPSLVVGGM